MTNSPNRASNAAKDNMADMLHVLFLNAEDETVGYLRLPAGESVEDFLPSSDCVYMAFSEGGLKAMSARLHWLSGFIDDEASRGRVVLPCERCGCPAVVSDAYGGFVHACGPCMLAAMVEDETEEKGD